MRFFDIQVNGFGGVDFNQDDLTPEDLNSACRQLQAEGVEGILATIITETPEKMIARLERLVYLRKHDPLAKSVIARSPRRGAIPESGEWFPRSPSRRRDLHGRRDSCCPVARRGRGTRPDLHSCSRAGSRLPRHEVAERSGRGGVCWAHRRVAGRTQSRHRRWIEHDDPSGKWLPATPAPSRQHHRTRTFPT